MNLCPTCWNAGRSLFENCCMCNFSVGNNSDFHAWSIKNRVPYNLPKEKVVEKVAMPKRRLIFGEKV